MIERLNNIAVVQNTMQQYFSFKYLYVGYLRLCNKLSWNTVTLNNSYYESSIWAQLNRSSLAQNLSRGFIFRFVWQSVCLQAHYHVCQKALVIHLVSLSSELSHKAVGFSQSEWSKRRKCWRENEKPRWNPLPFYKLILELIFYHFWGYCCCCCYCCWSESISSACT